jgi:hypothetical protein
MNAKQYDLIVEAFSRRKFLRIGSAALSAAGEGRAWISFRREGILQQAAPARPFETVGAIDVSGTRKFFPNPETGQSRFR